MVRLLLVTAALLASGLGAAAPATAQPPLQGRSLGFYLCIVQTNDWPVGSIIEAYDVLSRSWGSQTSTISGKGQRCVLARANMSRVRFSVRETVSPTSRLLCQHEMAVERQTGYYITGTRAMPVCTIYQW